MSKTRPTISVEQAQRPFFVGVDVGGTTVKIGLVDDLGRTFGFQSICTEQEKGPADAVQRIRQAIEQLLAKHGLQFDAIKAIGLGTPGTMDIPAGMILEPPNLPGWRHFPIRDRLSQACGRPVTFANDANAAAYGEYWMGSGRSFSSIILLTLGTGVGGGIIIGDFSIEGEHSHGAECGHIIVDCSDGARICSCGQRGHLEAYASATALVKRTEDALQSHQASSLRELAAQGQPITPILVGKEAEAGDQLALEIVMDTARYLGVGIVSLMHVIDPAAVILGGAMNFGGPQSDLGSRFLDRIRQVVQNRTFPVLAERTVIDFASLGSDAGYIGAAGIARTKS